jgi:hypothetical protein
MHQTTSVANFKIKNIPPVILLSLLAIHIINEGVLFSTIIVQQSIGIDNLERNEIWNIKCFEITF